MKNKNQKWMGFFGLFALFAIPGLIRGKWIWASWLVWVIWFYYFFKDSE